MKMGIEYICVYKREAEFDRERIEAGNLKGRVADCLKCDGFNYECNSRHSAKEDRTGLNWLGLEEDYTK